MNEPRRWTLAELTDDAREARELFRRKRMEEPLELYTRFFEAFAPVFGKIIDRLPSLTEDSFETRSVAEMVRDPDVRTAFRYLAAPPVSEDDLKTLAESTLSAAALRSDDEQARRVRDTVLHIIDPHRFPWIGEGRKPTDQERAQAIVASAVLVAARKVETLRRSDAKKKQERAVKVMLGAAGFTEVATRDIALLDAAPAPGEFCGESKLGDSRADLVVRLRDHRVMPVECKVSNSAVNSFKRINHEAVGKARAWLAGFGGRQTVPVAVISGVFNPANLETAQTEGLAIVWSHRLEDLGTFIESNREEV
ncbi:MAG: XamI family restriction endonuclease [Rhodospirillaceae bacterium]|nr:XamI family restriction endonuclease [Rhodospirillaceae bacterium]